MILLSGKKVSQKLGKIAWRAYTSIGPGQHYWRAKFPNRIASFDEMPTIEGSYDPRKLPEVAMQWFHKYGHVARQQMHFGKYLVHLFHFEDINTVYRNDGRFPIRQSPQVLAQYRRENRFFYDNVGLGAGNGQEWYDLRKATTALMRQTFNSSSSEVMLEEVADDLVQIVQNNLNDKGEIELLPWLFRWTFESIGAISLSRRLNALCYPVNERAEKLVKALRLTDEIIALTTLDPATDYEKRYRQLAEAQDYIYGEIREYLDDIKRDMEVELETGGIAQTLLRNKSCSENDVTTVILDLFQGSMQTVSLTALMAVYNLARNGDVQTKLREETKERMPTKDTKFYGGTPTYVPTPFAREVIDETLRLTPPIIGNGRIIQKDLVLGGYSVPEFTNVLLHHQVPSLLKENYEYPLKFIPGRTLRKYPLYIFGGGARMCPGQNFAMDQLLLLVAKLTRHFEFSYDGGEVKMINKLHNVPEEPLILRLKPVEE